MMMTRLTRGGGEVGSYEDLVLRDVEVDERLPLLPCGQHQPTTNMHYSQTGCTLARSFIA